MMGPRKWRKPKLFYTEVNLDERVPADHPLRRIAEAVDFGWVRQAVRERPDLREIFSLGRRAVIVTARNQAVLVDTDEGIEELDDAQVKAIFTDLEAPPDRPAR